MIAPPKHPQEAARLASLHSLRILDTPREERFDRVTRTAQRLFGVPIALVSLVDAERQWFKSCQGLDLVQAPLDTSFCGHAILQDEPLVVPDARLDERFHDNPAVVGEPHVRFYVGYPLKGPDGYNVGVLGLVAHEPRAFSAQDLEALKDLAAMAEANLGMVQLNQALQAAAEVERVLQRQAAELQMQASLLDLAHDAILVRNLHDTAITFWNAGAEEMYGWTAEEALGRGVHELLGTRFPQPLEAIRAELMAEGRWEGELRHRTRDGHEIVVASRWALRRDEQGRPAGVLEINSDVTAQRKIHDQWLQAKVQAEEASRAKSMFLANMSHELRTPLNAIIGYAEMLREEAEDLGQTAFMPDLSRIHAAGKHLLGLINEILDLSKVEAGKVELQPEEFAVHELVHDVAHTLLPLIERQGNALSLTVADDVPLLQLDPTKVRQVLYNLLSNAGKFTERGRVALTVTREDDRVVFRVEDTGIGMAPEHLGKIFQDFSQADASTTRKYGGTGLGLAISRRYCQLMGGVIEVQSELGRGSVFVVRLPFRLACPLPPRTPDAMPAPEGPTEPLERIR